MLYPFCNICFGEHTFSGTERIVVGDFRFVLGMGLIYFATSPSSSSKLDFKRGDHRLIFFEDVSLQAAAAQLRNAGQISAMQTVRC